MAVTEFYGADPQAYGWDMTQFKTEEEKILLKKFIHYFRNGDPPFRGADAAVNEDGLILLIPEMNFAPWNWEPDCLFIKKGYRDFNFEKNFNWHHFDVLKPDYCKYPITIYYKLGIMPRVPDPINIFHSRTRATIWAYLGWDAHYYQPVIQGGILYKKRQIWEKANYELAFHDNPKYFKECVLNRKIFIW